MPNAIEPLGTDELLRVMDTAQVLHQRRQHLDENEAFDRRALIRDIQVIYEGIGDLVDADVIGEALDAYLAERYAFRPTRPGLGTAIARAYVKRGRFARRVLLPTLLIAGTGWLGWAGWGWSQDFAQERERAALETQLEDARARWAARSQELASLKGEAAPLDLPDNISLRFGLQIGSAAEHLDRARALLAEGAVEAPGDPQDLTGLTRAVVGARVALERASDELTEARDLVGPRLRFASLVTERARLETAIATLALEPDVVRRARDLSLQAARFETSADLDNLEAAVAELAELEEALKAEYTIVITGGRWRYPDDQPDIRNYYLIVEAQGPDGERLPVRITNEETGITETVTEWGERVAQEAYERVRVDREDNGIIDDADFGRKRAGYLAPERAHPDLGQITRW